AAIPSLTSQFSVSQSAIAVRLRHLGRISEGQLSALLETARRIAQERRAQAAQRPGGPPYPSTHLRNLGATYVSAVLDAMDSDQISPVDAGYMLESKLKTIEHMRELLTSQVSE